MPRFALGRKEVTFDEWDLCAAEGFCREIAEDEGWGRGGQPVINVSWQDVTGEGGAEQGFLAWLNTKAEGAPYRLPTEAEWEYAARAGTADGVSRSEMRPSVRHRRITLGTDECCNGHAEGEDRWVNTALLGR